MSLYTGVHHVSLNCSDAEETTRFYTEILGMESLDRPDFGFAGAWLAFPDGRQVHLLEVGEGHSVTPGQHFAIRVDDIEVAVADLRAKGVEVGDPSPVGAGLQAFFKDPAGNELELNQPQV